MLPSLKVDRVAFSQLPSTSQSQPSLSTGGFNTNRSAATPKVAIIQNDLLCNPCTAIASLIEHDIEYHVVFAFHENALKKLHPLHYDAIIVLGGRAAVYEESGYLLKEMEFMVKSLEFGVPILGICLGSQLLAKCVGGEVVPGLNGPEIGYKKWTFSRSRSRTKSKESGVMDHDDEESDHSAESKGSTDPQHDVHHRDPYALTKRLNESESDGPKSNLKDLKLSVQGRSQSAAFMEHRRSPKVRNENVVNEFEMKMAEEMAEIEEMDEFQESETEVFEDDSDREIETEIAAITTTQTTTSEMASKPKPSPFLIHRRPQDDSSDDEDDIKSESTESPDVEPVDDEQKDVDLDSNKMDEDPLESVICREGMDRFVILFHGDKFSLPPKCSVTNQDIELLAKTDHYNQLFRVGRYHYGFQGHPELTYDMLSVWW